MSYSEEELLKNLQKVSSQVEGSLSRGEYVDHEDSIYSAEPFYRVFDSWNDAKKEAELEVGKPAELSREQLLNEIRRLADEVRDPPRENDLKEHGRYSGPPYYEEFGSWNEAVDAAGLEPYENLDPYTDIECDYCGETEKRRKSHIENQENVFCSKECQGDWWSENKVGKDHPKYDREMIECAVCGDEFGVKPSTVKIRRTCSQLCRRELQSREYSGEDNPRWKGGKVEVECANCGDTKKVKKAISEYHERHFCDYECRSEWKNGDWIGEDNPRWKGGKVEVECANCGSDLTRKPSIAKKQGRYFCDEDCQGKWRSENLVGSEHPSWAGGYEGYYGPSWPEARRQVRKRDGYKCRRCGTTEKEHIKKEGTELHVHHIEKFSRFDSHEEANELKNLITLCVYCHRKIEGLPVDNR
jgi:hypothetical protein